MNKRELERGNFLLFDKLKRKMKYNHMISAMVGFIIVGYIFFFTSNSWMPTKSGIVSPTQINTVKQWNDREITLLSWEYSKNQRMMEVQLDIKNKGYDGIKTYDYTALILDKGYCEVEEIINKNNLIVLRINNIDTKWTDISLRIAMPDDENEVLKLYTNKNVVAQVDNIVDMSYEEYMVKRLDAMIVIYNSNIEELKDKILSEENTINICEATIEELEASKEFQTALEIEETDSLISAANSQITSSQSLIADYEADIAEFEERISNVNEQMKTYLK